MTTSFSNIARPLNQFITSTSWMRFIIISLGLLALILGLMTFQTLVASQALESTSRRAILLLTADLTVLLALAMTIAYKLVRGRRQSPSGRASARLQAKLIRWFGLLLITPAILITVFSVIFFNMGIESWFGSKVQTAIQQSSEVAQAYLTEHKKLTLNDARAIAKELTAALPQMLHQKDIFKTFINHQAQSHALSEVVVFTPNFQVLARSELAFDLLYEMPSLTDLRRAKKAPILFETGNNDRVRALIQIAPNIPIFLLVGRFVDPEVLDHIHKTESAVHEYNTLETMRTSFEIQFILMFIAVSLLLLMLVIWIGTLFANRLARPIGNLIEAAEIVSAGHLHHRVQEPKDLDELGLLSHAFNRMTEQLESQRDKLLQANQQIDRRRHFIETVLSGVSAGVLGLNSRSTIDIANDSAAHLLQMEPAQLKGKALHDVMPELSEMLKQVEAREVEGGVQSQVTRTQANRVQTLLVKISVEKTSEDIDGYVITFDDITALLGAQRKAAWGDVARRVAHEIKNPLTPIQLSAERLKRRYLPQIRDESDSFQRYVDTIVRQVSYIGEMVNEFSAFARMPAPAIRQENLVELCEQALFLQQEAHPSIQFDLKCEYKSISLNCDAAQIGRVFTNLLQNSIDSINSRRQTEADFVGQLMLTIRAGSNWIDVFVDDNGEGLPTCDRAKLTEPYVTFRKHGTGLGLAIVKRILEDHGGTVTLGDSPLKGARVQLHFQTQT
ncbi:MAG: PAS domain-containing sensor histidine kinase [Pseudomonadota bacterium]